MKLTISCLLAIAIVAMLILTVHGVQKPDKGSQRGTSSPGSPDTWGQVSAGLQLSARLEKESVQKGEPIKVTLVLRNTTNETLGLVRTNLMFDYTITVKDEAGGKIPMTKFLADQLRFGPHSASSVYIAPKEEIQQAFSVNELYDMTAVGTYFLTFKRNVPVKGSKKPAEVVSNTVKVKVIP